MKERLKRIYSYRDRGEAVLIGIIAGLASIFNPLSLPLGLLASYVYCVMQVSLRGEFYKEIPVIITLVTIATSLIVW